MSKYHKKFKPTDFFFVYCGWYHGKNFLHTDTMVFKTLGLNREQFFYMFNSEEEMDIYTRGGFFGDLINQNAWLDENLVMRPLALQKKYDAIYVARRSAFKRHFLAADIESLALVAGNNHGNDISDIPPHTYLNDHPLTPTEVAIKINESRCGLILSEIEGACFSSSEYLMCGVPVVSTKSKGGRDAWYDEYNSVIVEPNVSAVKSAVLELINNPRDPSRIARDHSARAINFRRRFIEALSGIFSRFDIYDINAEDFFRDNFLHKMRNSMKPDFKNIFI